MGEFIFYFASQAYYSETVKAFPKNGVKNYGDLVHKYRIPVTWLTNTEGARLGKEIFTEFHDKYGDEVILWGMPSTKGNTSEKRDYLLNLSEEQVFNYLKEEQQGILKYLPFARVDHIGFFYRTLPAVRAMLRLGIKSCYGHCWEMIATDGVTDNGTPWGFYYIDTDKSWKRPHPISNGKFSNKSGIIANEWLQHDLNKSWNYYGSCSVFSWDPNDVERAKICDGRSIEYWKAGFREYYRNRAWNEFIPFVFHQEAHEQESTPGGFQVYPQETVDNTYEMTDEFLKFITSGEFKDMKIMSLPAAIELYRQKMKITNPTYMLFKDIPINMPIWNERYQKVWDTFQNAKKEEEAEGTEFSVEKSYESFSYFGFPYGWQGMVQKTPGDYFPESFVYYDTECELFFHRSISEPMKIWNYLKEIDSDPKNLYFNSNLFKEELPTFTSKKLEKSNRRIEFEFSINSALSIPYGICIWHPDQYQSTLRTLDRTDIIATNQAKILELKEIDDKVLFIRLDIQKGNTNITINK